MKAKIIVFDMDGVLVNINSSWRFVHENLNVDNSDNLNRFLSHEIGYSEFMKRDIKLWGKVNIGVIEEILARVQLVQGAKPTVVQLKKAGYKTAIISAGISILAERLERELEIDYVFANRIVVGKNGTLIGRGEEVVNPLNKKIALRRLASKEGITPARCAVVGDTIFDVPMFEEAGFSIAFNTNDERVREAADVVIQDKDLENILPYFTR
jgi:phosphoserine phosphatase